MSEDDSVEKPSVNPLLVDLKIPGETFRLPSQGLFYTNGELDESVKNGEVHVYPMNTMDELLFKTPDMLYTGNAVDTVFKRCIPQILKPRSLLSKDVDYLLACLRLITYGPTMTLLYTHNCKDAKEHEYVVELRPIIAQAKAIDPTSLASTFVVTVENGQIVHLKPSTFNSIMELSQSIDVSNKVPSMEDLQKSIDAVMVDMVASVNNVTNKDHIQEWLRTISAGWMRQITDGLNEAGNWGASFSTTCKCKDCEQDIKLEFSTNPISFFS